MEHIKMIETDIDAGIDVAENIDNFLIGNKIEIMKQETSKPKEKNFGKETRTIGTTLRNRLKTLNLETKFSNRNRMMEITEISQTGQLNKDILTNKVGNIISFK